MERQRDLKEVQERQLRIVSKRPGAGRGTRTSRARVVDGLKCEIEDGNYRFTTDLSSENGGVDAGPDPGTLARAALASCIAQIYVLWAARMDIPLASVEVEVQANFDIRGRLGVPGHNAGWESVRFATTISSPAPEEKVREMVAMAEKCSPILDDISRAVPLQGSLTVLAPAAVG
jgi:uncharacterized OsmC-like protein